MESLLVVTGNAAGYGSTCSKSRGYKYVTKKKVELQFLFLKDYTEKNIDVTEGSADRKSLVFVGVEKQEIKNNFEMRIN